MTIQCLFQYKVASLGPFDKVLLVTRMSLIKKQEITTDLLIMNVLATVYCLKWSFIFMHSQVPWTRHVRFEKSYKGFSWGMLKAPPFNDPNVANLGF